MDVDRHPEVRAQRASKGDGPGASAASFEARRWRAPQDDGNTAPCAARYSMTSFFARRIT